MSNCALAEIPDVEPPGSSPGLIRPTNDDVAEQHQPVDPGRPAAALIAQHPELVANLLASLNPAPPPLAKDLALFHAAMADIRRAAADGILTDRETSTLVVAVIEGFAVRQATSTIASAIRSAMVATGT